MSVNLYRYLPTTYCVYGKGVNLIKLVCDVETAYILSIIYYMIIIIHIHNYIFFNMNCGLVQIFGIEYK